jgi:predicted dehydrogenase
LSELNCAVIGVGYLGKFHAQKYAKLSGCKLSAVVDANASQGREIADSLGVLALSDYRELIGNVDAVSIATPTRSHYAIAREFLDAGVSVLVEKPITVTVAEADELIRLAKARDCVLQVGHLERFNPALRAVEASITAPLFIESHRLAPFNPRGTDVNVILDLMIHDIDIILHLVKSPVVRIDASGAPVISDAIDLANVRIQFESGCVANVTASRVSDKRERKIRIFQRQSCINVDFQNNTAKLYRTGEQEMYPGVPEIISETHELGAGDAILAEVESFVEAVRTRGQPLVSGEDGKRALAVATEITERLSAK